MTVYLNSTQSSNSTNSLEAQQYITTVNSNECLD